MSGNCCSHRSSSTEFMSDRFQYAESNVCLQAMVYDNGLRRGLVSRYGNIGAQIIDSSIDTVG